MDIEKQQEIFEDRYQDKLGISFQDWLDEAPANENDAYAYCEVLDQELKNTYEQWFNSQGEVREELENYRDRLKLEYDLIEDMFGLELNDR